MNQLALVAPPGPSGLYGDITDFGETRFLGAWRDRVFNACELTWRDSFPVVHVVQQPRQVERARQEVVAVGQEVGGEGRHRVRVPLPQHRVPVPLPQDRVRIPLPQDRVRRVRVLPDALQNVGRAERLILGNLLILHEELHC